MADWESCGFSKRLLHSFPVKSLVCSTSESCAPLQTHNNSHLGSVLGYESYAGLEFALHLSFSLSHSSPKHHTSFQLRNCDLYFWEISYMLFSNAHIGPVWEESRLCVVTLGWLLCLCPPPAPCHSTHIPNAWMTAQGKEAAQFLPVHTAGQQWMELLLIHAAHIVLPVSLPLQLWKASFVDFENNVDLGGSDAKVLKCVCLFGFVCEIIWVSKFWLHLPKIISDCGLPAWNVSLVRFGFLNTM